MMSKFHSLTVSEIDRQTDECVAVSFAVPDELQKDFSFVSGQYLTLETTIHGEEVRRSYSLCSAPFEGKWTVAIKKVPNGKFSTYANEQLSVGDEIQVMLPTGNFQLSTKADSEKHYVAFAAGSGITPVFSMVKSVLEEEPKSQFSLFYGNRNFDSIIFREEIEDLKNTFLSRFSVHHILSKEKLGSPLFFGRINGEKCQRFGKTFYDKDSVDGFYLCGPAPMIFEVKDTLVEQGVAPEKIHFELFSTDGLTPKTEVVQEVADFDPNTESMVKVILDSETVEFPLAYGGDNVLDAALKQGLDLPFACKGGVCSTCKAKITDGEVKMDLNYALEPDELERGFVLTCQSHPRTSKITVNFDES